MSKRKLDKTDIGEMYHWASSAFCAGFLKVEIDSDHAIELCERALDSDRLAQENAKLREFVEMVAAGDSAGDEAKSIMVHTYIYSAKQLLNQLKDQNNDK
jgi:hypothetical protein